MSKTLYSAFRVLKLLLSQPPLLRITAWSMSLYTLLYLWALGDLRFHLWRSAFEIIPAHDPLAMIFKARSAFYFEGIAIIKLPLLTYLFSPVNLALALMLGMLVGLNLAASYFNIKKKRVHGRAVAPLAASVPALMAGTACSAPLVLVLLGIQATAWLLALFSILVPAALLLLIVTLLINLSRIHPEELP